MLRAIKIIYKNKQITLTSYELLSIVIKLFQKEHEKINNRKPRISRMIKKSAFEPSKLNTLHNSDDWIKLGLSLQQGEISEASVATGYRVGGRHIVFMNPSDRYAIDYGKYISLQDMLSDQFKRNEYFQKRIKDAQNDPKIANELLLQLAIGLYVIQRADEKLISEGKAFKIEPQEDALTDENKSDEEEKQEKLAYITLYKLLNDHFEGNIQDVNIAKQIRQILNGEQELKIVNCSALPVLTGALFAAELSRNPTCFLSGLILLDFVEAGITYGKTKKTYTWEKILWDPTVIQEKLSGEEKLDKKAKLLADRNGGKHPMTHRGSYSREFSIYSSKTYKDDQWKLDKVLLEEPGDLMPPFDYVKKNSNPLATARKKEGSLLIRWLFHIFNQITIEGNDSEITHIEISKDHSGISTDIAENKAIKDEFISNILEPLISERMESLDSMLDPYTKYDFALEKSVPCTDTQILSKTIHNSFSTGHPFFGNIATLSNKAETALKEKDYKNALIYFENLLQIQPKNPNWYHKVGLTYFSLNKYDDAIYYYDMCCALATNPELIKKVESDINNARLSKEINTASKSSTPKPFN